MSNIINSRRSFVLLCFVLSLFSLALSAQTFTILHNFAGSPDDGATPNGVALDVSGNVYGTTSAGGAFATDCQGGCGTVFKIDSLQNETVFYNFGPSASDPLAVPTRDRAGNLYGSTASGGTGNFGTLYQLDAEANFTLLYAFQASDGANPNFKLLRNTAGDIYGVTTAGGSSDKGVIYKLSADGTETVLYSFSGETGEVPSSRLVPDTQGNFYGATGAGGRCQTGVGCGVVYRYSTHSGTEKVVHVFSGAPDGELPYGDLVRDADGNLYGVTFLGGVNDLGAIYKIDSTGAESILHSFSGADGVQPASGLVLDATGNLYGTTASGGAFGRGVIFTLTAAGKFKLLHSFNGTDGSNGQTVLARDGAGNIYGTTLFGGSAGYGVAYKLTP